MNTAFPIVFFPKASPLLPFSAPADRYAIADFQKFTFKFLIFLQKRNITADLSYQPFEIAGMLDFHFPAYHAMKLKIIRNDRTILLQIMPELLKEFDVLRFCRVNKDQIKLFFTVKIKRIHFQDLDLFFQTGFCNIGNRFLITLLIAFDRRYLDFRSSDAIRIAE